MVRLVQKLVATTAATILLTLALGTLPAEAKETHPCPSGSQAYVQNAKVGGTAKGGDKAKGYTYTQTGHKVTTTEYPPYQVKLVYAYSRDDEPEATGPPLKPKSVKHGADGTTTFTADFGADFTKMKFCVVKGSAVGINNGGLTSIMSNLTKNLGWIIIGLTLLGLVIKSWRKRRGDE